MDAKILEQLDEYFNEEFSLIRHDLTALEALIKQKIRQLGQGLLQRAVHSKPNGYKGCSMACECGGSMRFVQHRSRDIHTLFGWILYNWSGKECSIGAARQILGRAGTGKIPAEQTKAAYLRREYLADCQTNPGRRKKILSLKIFLLTMLGCTAILFSVSRCNDRVIARGFRFCDWRVWPCPLVHRHWASKACGLSTY
jgi:hypothetical protein